MVWASIPQLWTEEKRNNKLQKKQAAPAQIDSKSQQTIQDGGWGISLASQKSSKPKQKPNQINWQNAKNFIWKKNTFGATKTTCKITLFRNETPHR